MAELKRRRFMGLGSGLAVTAAAGGLATAPAARAADGARPPPLTRVRPWCRPRPPGAGGHRQGGPHSACGAARRHGDAHQHRHVRGRHRHPYPLLNPGESAILALGTVAPRPWVHRGKVVPRQVTTLALSFDHRLVDGDLGSRVLADTAAVLHDPHLLLTRS